MLILCLNEVNIPSQVNNIPKNLKLLINSNKFDLIINFNDIDDHIETYLRKFTNKLINLKDDYNLNLNLFNKNIVLVRDYSKLLGNKLNFDLMLYGGCHKLVSVIFIYLFKLIILLVFMLLNLMKRFIVHLVH